MLKISALVYISFSELQQFNRNISPEWAAENPEEFKKVLWDVGLDTNVPWDYQTMQQHRNRFEQEVICDRIVGNERIDTEWINSGYASVAAKDKAAGNHLVLDLYRLKGLIED